MNQRQIDPAKATLTIDGRSITLASLADIRDEARAQHRAPDSYAVEDLEVRDSGAGDGQFTIRGHAAVFERLSHEMWGFREKIARGAFSEVLDRDPDVHALWDHSTLHVLGRTRNKSLELREDPQGLHMWTRVAPTSYSQDLRTLMEGGYIDQASFAFTVAEDRWEIENDGDDERVTRTIVKVRELYDVTVTAQGAYPQTDSSVVRSLIHRELSSGRLPEPAGATPVVAQDEPAGADTASRELARLKARARSRLVIATLDIKE